MTHINKLTLGLGALILCGVAAAIFKMSVLLRIIPVLFLGLVIYIIYTIYKASKTETSSNTTKTTEEKK